MVDLKVPDVWASAVGVSWRREDIGVLSLRSGSVLVAGLRTGFGAVAPGDVDVVRFWLGLFAMGISNCGGRGFWLVVPVGVVLAF